MRISVCIPCMNRTHDLRQVMPSLIAAANNSSPVEIAVLDYNSQDDLAEFILETQRADGLGSCELSYRRYTGRDYYHMAHAGNLSALASSGDYVLLTGADIFMQPTYLQVVRQELEKGYTWLHHSGGYRYVGVICVSRQEFMEAGGYDERFEFYGKSDKDLFARLHRRGAPHAEIPALLSLIPTPWDEKLKNYRLPLSRSQARKRSKPIYLQNIEEGVLVANEGKEWGSWE